MNADRLYFHDASLIGLDHTDQALTLTFEDVQRQDGSIFVCIVELFCPSGVVMDSAPVESIVAEAPDCDVLTFSFERGEFLLIVEWNDFAVKWHKVRAYKGRFDGHKLSLKIQSGMTGSGLSS